jgi:hypothetical protein
MLQPHFEASVRMKLTLPKVGTWNPLRLPKIQSLIARVKTPYIDVFFILLEKWPCMSHSNICTISYGQKKGQELNWPFNSRLIKIGNRPDPGVCRWSATHC